MPCTFPFSAISTLLSRLESISLHDPPYLPSDRYKHTRDVIQSWFASHRPALRCLDIETSTAVLSALLPEWRTDRVYDMQAARLSRRLARVMQLGKDDVILLEMWRVAGRGDLAECVGRVVKARGSGGGKRVEVGEVDEVMQMLASRSRFSDPAIQRQRSMCEGGEIDGALGRLLQRMAPDEAKWFVRLLLKDFAPVVVDENLVLVNFHFLLPDLLRFQSSFTAAVTLLKTEFAEYPERPDPASAKLFRKMAAAKLVPVVGIKVGRPEFRKARGIDHCLTMLGPHPWAVERKYDGEYCEVHIDISKDEPGKWIKIFSKSGKDSTDDRRGLHPALIDGLRLGKEDSKVKSQAILLGEMVVYSDKHRCIMSFETIRNHDTRSGVFLGTGMNLHTAPPEDEHLAIVLFDLLLLDEEVVMRQPITARRARLRWLCPELPGRVMRAEWKMIDFSSSERARKTLLERFAMSNARREEGLVLKPGDGPYFSLTEENRFFVKLKKDLMGMGDEADFAVVGASYSAQLAAGVASSMAFSSAAGAAMQLRYTTFYLGCLVNAADLKRYANRSGESSDSGSSAIKPRFKLVGSISCVGGCIPRDVLLSSNILGHAFAIPCTRDPAAGSSPFEITPDSSRLASQMQVIFTRPLVWEVVGSRFTPLPSPPSPSPSPSAQPQPPPKQAQKQTNHPETRAQSNCRDQNENIPSEPSPFSMLTFPRVTKMHTDRSYLDCISFQELQAQARKAMATPLSDREEVKETREWLEKLERRCRRKIEREGIGKDGRGLRMKRKVKMALQTGGGGMQVSLLAGETGLGGQMAMERQAPLRAAAQG